MDWLHLLPAEERPKDLEFSVQYALSKLAISKTQWGKAKETLHKAIRVKPSPLIERRMALLAHREPLLDDEKWHSVRKRVEPANRLSATWLLPEVNGVWACGAYYSRGAKSGSPWSRLLRLTKKQISSEERNQLLRLTSSYFCRFALECTPLARLADLVVSIPANPARFSSRGFSMPDELAKALARQLTIPFLFEGLSSANKDIELKGLSWKDRKKTVKDAMEACDLLLFEGAAVLVVDDVITSGATMREAGRVLRKTGSVQIYALALAHTEG